MSILQPLESDLRQPVNASFDPETGKIKLHIDKVDFGFLERPINYNGKIFQPKSELHITIVSQDAEIIHKHLENHPDDISDLQDLVISANWAYRKLDDFYYVEKNSDVQTIIRMVELPNLTQFLKDLSKLLGQGFVRPPTHVTLYTRGTEVGIGIPSQAVFDELVKGEVNPTELRLAKKSAGLS